MSTDLNCKFIELDDKVDLESALFTDYEQDPTIRTYVEFRDDKFLSQTVEDPTPIYTVNKRLREDSDAHWNKDKELKHIATVPLAVWLKWERLGITQDSKALKKALKLHKEFLTTNRRI